MRSAASTRSGRGSPTTGPSATAEEALVAGLTRSTNPAPLRSQAARGALVNAAFTVGLGLLSLVRGFVLAGFLSRTDYGLWGIIVVSLSTLVWLKQAGLGDKFIQQDEPDQELAFQRAFTMELLLTLGCVLLIAVALPVLVLIYDLPRLVLPSLVVALALLVSVFQAPQWIYLRRMEYRRQQLLAAADPVVGFAVSVGLAAAGAGYWAFPVGMLAGVAAASLVAVRRSPYPLRLRYDRQAARGIWSFSGPLILASLGGFVVAWSAVLTARLALGVAAVGVISLADTIAGFTERVDDMLTGALYPAICAVRERRSLMYESLVKSNRLALMWAVPFGVGITLFCADLVHFLIGERWRSAIVVMEVFGIAAAVNNVGFNWTAYFRALDRTRPIAVASIAAAASFLLVGIPLIITSGLPGFAIAIAVQGVVALALRAYYLQQLFPGFDFLRHAAGAFLPSLPATGAVLLMRLLETGPRHLVWALIELGVYGSLTALATWRLESGLLREVVALVQAPSPGPASS